MKYASELAKTKDALTYLPNTQQNRRLKKAKNIVNRIGLSRRSGVGGGKNRKGGVGKQDKNRIWFARRPPGIRNRMVGSPDSAQGRGQDYREEEVDEPKEKRDYQDGGGVGGGGNLENLMEHDIEAMLVGDEGGSE